MLTKEEALRAAEAADKWPAGWGRCFAVPENIDYRLDDAFTSVYDLATAADTTLWLREHGGIPAGMLG